MRRVAPSPFEKRTAKKVKGSGKKGVQEAQKEKGKIPKRSPPARSGDAIRVSAKPSDVGLKVQKVRRTRKDEINLVLKKVGDVLAFEKAFSRTVGGKTEVRSLVSNRSLEIRDLDEIMTRDEVVAVL